MSGALGTMVEHVEYHIESKIFKPFILSEQKHLFLSEIIKKANLLFKKL